MMKYSRFLAIVATSTVVMFALMNLSSGPTRGALTHRRLQTRPS